jgi:selenocysteine lyase/cysteine desulfurase
MADESTVKAVEELGEKYKYGFETDVEVDKALASRALRVSLGPDNTQDDISLFLNSLKKQAARIRANAA